MFLSMVKHIFLVMHNNFNFKHCVTVVLFCRNKVLILSSILDLSIAVSVFLRTEHLLVSMQGFLQTAQLPNLTAMKQ